MTSQLSEFYERQTVLITGGTGFLGKAIVEKLLRSSQPQKIFILVRSKKGCEPEQRKDALLKEYLFKRVLAEVPFAESKIHVVNGDVSAEGLGLSEEDRMSLIQEVTLVFHSAATINFDEALKTASKTNIGGTIEMMKLCKKMKNLKALIHVSTAYSTTIPGRIEVKEKFYKAPVSSDLLMNMDSINNEEIAIMLPKILGEWPNTYSFTKNVTETVIEQSAEELPVAVFRPAIISGAYFEPEGGWVDNLNGFNGLIAGGGLGILRVLKIKGTTKSQLIPVDFTVNALLALGRKIAQESALYSKPPIYNFAVSKETGVDYDELAEGTKKIGSSFPSIKTFWYYTAMTTSDPRAFKILNLLFHIIPAFLFDFILTIKNKKPRLVRIYQKVLKFMCLITFFTSTDWYFHQNNIQAVWNDLDEIDKKHYNFDMYSIDWEKYMTDLVAGVRRHIYKEADENLESARKRYFRLWILHRIVQTLFYGILLWLVTLPLRSMLPQVSFKF